MYDDTSTLKELHVCLTTLQSKVFQWYRERRGRSEYVGETSRYVKCEEAKRCIVPLRSVVGGTFPRSGHLQPRDSSRRAYARACNGTHAFERYFEFRYAFIRYFSFCPCLRPVTSENKKNFFNFSSVLEFFLIGLFLRLISRKLGFAINNFTQLTQIFKDVSLSDSTDFQKCTLVSENYSSRIFPIAILKLEVSFQFN